MAANEQIVLTLGLQTQGALSQLDRDLSSFEKRRPLKINLDSSAINSATKSINAFDASIEKTGKHLLAFGASVATLELLRRGIEESVTSFVKLNAELARININLNTSQANLNDFGKSLFNIARNTGQSFDEVAKAAAIFAQQGNSVNETLKRTQAALILTRQSGLDLADSVEAITSTINEFKKESLDATDVINKFSSVEGKFAVSSKTIAEAVSRVGSAANESGVSLNQLIALITTASQVTQASGEKIATAFNTIFNNSRKEGTVEAFRQLGIQVEKIPGQYLPAIDILKNIASRYSQVSEVQKQQITQLVGGSRQLNILTAVLGDVNKNYGIYQQSLSAVTRAQDSAIQKNDQLNKSFAAQANAASQSLQQLAATIGKLTFQPLFDRTIGNVNSLSKILGDNSGSSAEKFGAQLGQGILKGIGNALAGPGLVIGGTILAKLIGQVGKYTISAAKDLLNTNSAAEKQQSLQQAINSALKQQGVSYQSLLALGNDRVKQEQYVLDLVKQQNAAKIGASALSTSLASSLYSQGARASGGKVSFADGYLPNSVQSAIQSEQTATSKNVGGSAGASPVVLNDFSIGGQKQTIVANSSEFLVPTTSLNPSYSGPDKVSIINPSMINSLGSLPAGAVPARAKGFAPNFAGGGIPYEAFSTYLGDQGSTILSSILPYILGGASAIGLGGIGSGLLKDFLHGSGKSGEIRGGFQGQLSPALAEFREDNRLFNNVFGGPSTLEIPPLNREELRNLELQKTLSGEFGEPLGIDEVSKLDHRNLRSRQLRAIKSISGSLYGASKTRHTLKSDLISRAASFGIDPGVLAGFNKRDIANIINNKVIENHPAADGLFQRGFEGSNTLGASEDNFNVLKKVGIRADGFVPNFALGDLVGGGFQSNVYDAGNLVYKEPRFKGSGTHNTKRGLQFLQGLINRDDNLQNLGLKVALPQRAPKALHKLFEGGGYFQEKIAGLRHATNNEAHSVQSFVDVAVKKRGLNTRKGFSSFKLNDFNSDNIFVDSQGNPIVIDLLTNKTENYRKILRGKNNFAGGFDPSKFDRLTKEEQQIFVNHPQELQNDALISQIRGDRKGVVRPKDRFPGLNPEEQQIAANIIDNNKFTPAQIQDVVRGILDDRNGTRNVQPSFTPKATDTISNIPSVAAPTSGNKQDLINQGRALGIKGLSARMREETILAKIAGAQGGGSGGLPPNIPIAPPAPSAPTPPPRRNNTPISVPSVTSSSSGILQRALAARNLNPQGNISDEDLRKLIIAFDKQTDRVTEPGVLNFGQPSALDRGRAAAVGRSFDASSLNLLNSAGTQALPLITPKGNIGPAVLDQVKSQLQGANAKFKNPLNQTELNDLAEKIVAQNLLAFSKQAQGQLANIKVDQKSLQSKIDALDKQNTSDTVSQKVQNSVSRGESLTPALQKAFLRQTKAELYKQFSPQSRNNPQVKTLVEKLANSELNNQTGQITQIQNDRSIESNNGTFTNSFINKYGGIRGGATTRANPEIEKFIQEQVGFGADEDTVRGHVSNLQSEARQRSFASRSQLGLQASFTLPLLAGAATSLAGNGLSDRAKSEVSGVTNSLSVGGTIASLAPSNPYVLGLAGVVTALGLFKTALDNTGPSLEEIQKASDDFSDKSKVKLDAIDQFIQARNNRDDIVANGGSKSQIATANQNLQSALQGIPIDIRNQLVNGTSDQNLQFRAEQTANDSQKALDFKISEDFAQFDKGALGSRSFLANGSGPLGPLNYSVLGNRFSGPDDPLLQSAAQDLANKKLNVGPNSTLRNGLPGLTKDDLDALLKLTQSFEDQADAADKASDATNKASDEFLNFNKNVSNAISQGIFQKVFAAQGNFNSQSNSINRLGGLLDANSDTLTPQLALNTRNSLALASIQAQTGLKSTQALGGGLDQLNNIFSNKALGRGSPELTNLAGNTISGIKNGSLFGDDAINALKQIAAEAVKDGSAGIGIQEEIKKILLDSSEKLATIGQEAQKLTDDQKTANDIANKILQNQTQRNFGGGVDTFTDPSKFNSISAPINTGISSLINRGLFNSPLQTNARRFNSLTPESAQSSAQNLNITNANFGRANVGLADALSALSGGDSSIQTKINNLVGGPKQLASDITSQRTEQFRGLASDTLGGLNNLQGDYSNSLFRLNREANQGASTQNFDKVLGDLTNLRKNSTNSSNQNSFDKVIQVFSILNDEIKKTTTSSATQANTILKSDTLPEELLKLQKSIDDSKNQNTNLIKSTTELINSQKALDDTLKSIRKLQSEGKNGDVGVDAKVNVAVQVAGNLSKDINGQEFQDQVKQLIIQIVKPSAINNAAPPRVST